MEKMRPNRKLLSRLFFRLLPYQVLLLVITAGTGIVDSIFASNFIGKAAMTAIGFYSPLNHFLYALSIMLVSGSQLLVGEALGGNKTGSVRRFFSTDLICSFVIALLVSVLLIVGALTGAVSLFGLHPDEVSAINMYLVGQAFGMPALLLGQQVFSFLSLENQTGRTTAASIVCFVSNGILDALFVIVFHMGTLGLGLATALSNFIFLSVMVVYYFGKRSEMRFSFRDFSVSAAKKIIKKGYPGAVSRFVEMIRNIVINMLIIRFVGSIGLSAFAAIDSVMALFWPVPFGMVAVSRMMMGISLGQQDRQSLSDINRIVFTRGVVLQCILTAVIMALSKPLALMFYNNTSDTAYMMTHMGLFVMPLCMPLSVICLQYTSYGQAVGKKFFSVFVAVMDGAVFVMACSFVLIPLMEMTGLYLSNILNGVLCCILILIYLIVKNKRFPGNMEEALVMDPGIGVAADERMDLSLNESDSVTMVSISVMEFCKRKGIDDRRTFFSGLATEEMARNVFEHGFVLDNKKHYINIHVVHTGDDIVIRITDNCPAFDPLSRAVILDRENTSDIPVHEHMVDNIGIRLVNRILKEVRYQNLLGLNILTMKT
ncbi:MAG: ATP-binding protein [Eubacterium sp.]|nr:ATP-binding protein [Eubacterium sp.]